MQHRRPVAEAFGALRGKIKLADDFDELAAELFVPDNAARIMAEAAAIGEAGAPAPA